MDTNNTYNSLQNAGDLLPVGTRLNHGKYVVERHLSSGGFGKTYVAIDTAFDEKVVIKELYLKGVNVRGTDHTVSVSQSDNAEAFAAQQRKFRKEAQRIRKLSNPHIVRVHDLFDENGTSYYVMDYVDGETLGDITKRTGVLQETVVRRLLPQLLDALECTHEHGIWHMDLKPANILLDRNGKVQLIDFGASKQMRSSGTDTMMTTSIVAFTQGYAPIEQTLQDSASFGPWTDFYALGATLYRLLTLNPLPLPTDVKRDPIGALPFPDTVSQRMRNLIFWLMKFDHEDRPQSAAEIRNSWMSASSDRRSAAGSQPPVGPQPPVGAARGVAPARTDGGQDTRALGGQPAGYGGRPSSPGAQLPRPTGGHSPRVTTGGGARPVSASNDSSNRLLLYVGVAAAVLLTIGTIWGVVSWFGRGEGEVVADDTTHVGASVDTASIHGQSLRDYLTGREVIERSEMEAIGGAQLYADLNNYNYDAILDKWADLLEQTGHGDVVANVKNRRRTPPAPYTSDGEITLSRYADHLINEPKTENNPANQNKPSNAGNHKSSYGSYSGGNRNNGSSGGGKAAGSNTGTKPATPAKPTEPAKPAAPDKQKPTAPANPAAPDKQKPIVL